MMLNNYGTLSNDLPHHHYTFKASKKHDPDTPTLSEAMAGIHNKGFKESINK